MSAGKLAYVDDSAGFHQRRLSNDAIRVSLTIDKLSRSGIVVMTVDVAIIVGNARDVVLPPAAFRALSLVPSGRGSRAIGPSWHYSRPNFECDKIAFSRLAKRNVRSQSEFTFQHRWHVPESCN